jgi:hypothetical protein
MSVTVNHTPKGTHKKTAKLAYELWEMEGRPHGRALDHWFTAEACVLKQELFFTRQINRHHSHPPRYYD